MDQHSVRECLQPPNYIYLYALLIVATMPLISKSTHLDEHHGSGEVLWNLWSDEHDSNELKGLGGNSVRSHGQSVGPSTWKRGPCSRREFIAKTLGS